MSNNQTHKLYTPNRILDTWNPIKWGFHREFHRTKCNTLHTYYVLEITSEITLEVACSQYPCAPNDKVEQSVEINICGNYELLAHIDSKTKMATLIRSLSGKSPRYFAMKTLRE